MRDQALDERLICDADLTLEKLQRVTRQRKAVREQQDSLKGDGSQKHPIVLDEVRSGRPGAKDTGGNKHEPKAVRRGFQKTSQATSQEAKGHFKGKLSCKRCGKSHENTSYCPAREATCLNAVAKVTSLFRVFQTVSAVSSEHTEEAYLFSVTTSQGRCWSSTIKVGEYKVDFKLDTGAEATVIAGKNYKGSINQHYSHQKSYSMAQHLPISGHSDSLQPH